MLLSKFASVVRSQTKRLPARCSSLIGKQPARHGSGKRVLYMFVSKASPFKRWFLIYTAVGAIPLILTIFYTSYIVADSELYDYDPEQYEPEFHEYFDHPITRFLAKYCVEDPRISYYKDIYALELESHHFRTTRLLKAVTEIEKYMGFRGWRRWEDTIRFKGLRDPLEEYVEEHEIGVKVKR